MADPTDNLPLPPAGNIPDQLPPAPGPVAPTLQGPTSVPSGESQFATQDTGSPAPSSIQLPPRTTGTSIAAQPRDRSAFFRQMLGDFFYAAGQGLAQTGHGPGSFGRGLGAGLSALPQRDIINQQLDIQRQQAQSMEIYRQAQAESLTPSIRMLGPDGNEVLVPPAHVGQALAAQYRLAGTLGGATIRAGAQQKPIETILKEAKDAYDRGDTAIYQAKLKEANELATAGKATTPAAIWGRLTPEMAAIGVPPNPADFPAGVRDPRFLQAVKDYGNKVTDLKQKNALALAQGRGISYAYGRAKYLQVPVLDQDTQQIGFATPLEIAGTPGKYAPMTEGDKLMMKNAVFEDIRGAAKNFGTALSKNKDNFSVGQIGAMTAAIDADPSGGLLGQTIGNLVRAGGKDALTPTQQDVAVAMQQSIENAYALRSILGAGQGSDELRKAIRNTLPSVSSPPGYAEKQLAAFNQQVDRLQRGLPSIPMRNVGGGGGTSTSGTGKLTEAEAQQYLNRVGGDPKKAMALAKKEGRTFD